MKRKILFLATVFTVIALSVLLCSCKGGSEGLEFVEMEDGTYGVKCGEATDTEIVIPKKHNGEKVTAILSSAFINKKNITSIEIPKTVIKMEKGAFYGCDNLKSVYYGGRVGDWNKIEFAHSTANPMSEGERFFAKKNEITELKIEDAEKINAYAFFGFEGITRVELDNTVKEICENAFAGCESLSELVLPSSLESIGKQAFANCNKLKDVIIPASTFKIDTLAFYNTELKTLTFENSEKWYFTKKEEDKSGTNLDLSDVEKNAKMISKAETGFWKRKIPVVQ